MASFIQSYQRTAAFEGGYQNNPADPGNYNSRGELVGTNYGISAPVLESWKGRTVTEADMRNLSREEAQYIYKAKYWNRIKGDAIENQPLADIFFDGTVNHGTTGIKMMQKILNVTPDGVVGPVTLATLNGSDAARTYNAYKAARESLYRKIVQSRPSMGVFLKGWLRRIASFSDYGSAAIGGSAIIALGIIAWWWFGRKKARA